MKNLDENRKVGALYKQLKFHHIVLDLVAPKSSYFQKSFTSKGRKLEFTSNDMKKHLLEILKINIQSLTPIEDVAAVLDNLDDENPIHSLVSKRERNEELEKEKEIFQEHLEEARMKRKSKVNR